MSFYRTYRAPAEHGTALIEPSPGDAGAAMVQNRTESERWDLAFGGTSVAELRQAARREMIRDALHYSRMYRDVSEPGSADCIVMAGHQPSLFHPGVWFKNFALDRVAHPLASGASKDSICRATAINLVIDNDVANSSAVRVPVIDAQSGWIRQAAVAFDEAAGGVPYEQNRIRDRHLFDSFDVRLREAIHPLVREPLVGRLWPHARAAANRCENVSCAVAQARHALEGEVGLQTLELPLSVLCRSESFAAFAVSILGDLVRFRTIYNECVKHYRVHHGIRSKAHPVPELGAVDEWTEAPFWIYGDDSPQRRAAWVRRAGGGLEISDRGQRSVHLTSSPDSPNAAAELASCGTANWKLRPRALMTTMYARMILSDLFMHGIGGAKYDQLGDQIMHRFFGVTPPAMMVVSATIQLPVEGLGLSAATVTDVKRQLREIRFAPERFAAVHELPAQLLERKRQLISHPPEDTEKKAWHAEVSRINRELEHQLSGVRTELESQLAAAKQAAASAAVIRSREYSFCLFELDDLLATYKTLLS
ncbi:MAG: hypothetical protein ACO1RT_18270 [Planctomycetaceae bacterium]